MIGRDGSAAAAVAGGVYLGTPVADGDNVGQHILLFRHTILDSEWATFVFYHTIIIMLVVAVVT